MDITWSKLELRKASTIRKEVSSTTLPRAVQFLSFIDSTVTGRPREHLQHWQLSEARSMFTSLRDYNEKRGDLERTAPYRRVSSTCDSAVAELEWGLKSVFWLNCCIFCCDD